MGGEHAIRELNKVWGSGWDRRLSESCHEALYGLGERAHPVLLRMIDDPEDEQESALYSLRASRYPEADLAALALRLIVTTRSGTSRWPRSMSWED